MAGKRYGIKCLLGGTYLLGGILVGLSGRKLSLLLHLVLLCWRSFFLLSSSSRCCLLEHESIIYPVMHAYSLGQFISSLRCCCFSTEGRALFKQFTILLFIVILWVNSPATITILSNDISSDHLTNRKPPLLESSNAFNSSSYLAKDCSSSSL